MEEEGVERKILFSGFFFVKIGHFCQNWAAGFLDPYV